MGELPLPGPAERYGPRIFLWRFRLSSSLAMLNARQLSQIVKQGVGEDSVTERYRGAMPTPETYDQAIRYALPLAGEWLVYNGGVTPQTSHSWDVVGQRYAYDFVIAEGNGRRHSGKGRQLQDYFAYDQPVLAPADGEVVAVKDGVRDAPRVGTGWVDWRCRDFRGNWVVISHAENEYSFSAHLRPGSIGVAPGDEVGQGDEIGRVGNSGHSTEPHLHFHIQDRADFFRSASLPVFYSDLLIDGNPAQGKHYLEAGQRVCRVRGARAEQQ